MYETFRVGFMKRWSVWDECIEVGNREIPFSDIADISISLPTGSFGDGIVNLVVNGKLTYLYFPGKDTERAKKAIDYVIDHMNPDGKAEPYEYRKKCSVCGFVMCYTRDDVRNNEKYIQQEKNKELGAAFNNLFSYTYAIQSKMDADSARSKIRDFSRCPKCNSTNLIDIDASDIDAGDIDAGDIDTDEMNAVDVTADSNSQTVTNTVSYIDELRVLKGLLDDGIITQEEFDAKKKQLLGL